ncbi:protease, partial [Streptomyces laculatispora]|nr:protease [Streptomyces laculatispora]
MDDGKPTEPKAKWWSRPTAGRSTSTAPQEPSPVEDAVPPVDATGASDGAEVAPEGPVTAETLTAETVPQAARPLHEPDQYSTPPYGGPGPWALAPHVQRPVPTPAHGTPVPPPYAGTNGSGITTAPAPPAAAH